MYYEVGNTFNKPPADAVLWRYMSFTKFVSLLTKKSLFFARADKLGDPFEGSLSQVNIDLRPEIYKTTFPKSTRSYSPTSLRTYAASCW